MHLQGLEGLDSVSLDDLAGGLGLEHHLFAGEGVASHASFAGGLLLDDESGDTGNDKLATLKNK